MVMQIGIKIKVLSSIPIANPNRVQILWEQQPNLLSSNNELLPKFGVYFQTAFKSADQESTVDTKIRFSIFSFNKQSVSEFSILFRREKSTIVVFRKKEKSNNSKNGEKIQKLKKKTKIKKKQKNRLLIDVEQVLTFSYKRQINRLVQNRFIDPHYIRADIPTYINLIKMLFKLITIIKNISLSLLLLGFKRKCIQS